MLLQKLKVYEQEQNYPLVKRKPQVGSVPVLFTCPRAGFVQQRDRIDLHPETVALGCVKGHGPSLVT